MKKIALLAMPFLAAALTCCTARGGQSAASGQSVATTTATTDSIAVAPKKDTIKPIAVAAEDTAAYLPLLRGKKVALTANPTAQAFGRHLLDVMREGGVDVQKVFAHEHGFRGAAEPGEKVDTETDQKTGVKIVSLFGKTSNRRPNRCRGSITSCMTFRMLDAGFSRT